MKVVESIAATMMSNWLLGGWELGKLEKSISRFLYGLRC
jgi:hypothetical protein